jgi:hypothetical protein
MANNGINGALRTVVATTLDVIHSDNGYIAPGRNATTNTQSKVQAILNKNPNPTLDPEYWQFADEMIGFFRILESRAEFKTILTLPDGPMYKTCIDTAKADEVTPLTFPYAVAMPNLYSHLKPQKPKILNPLKSEAKIIKPGEYMGILNAEDRFFVKLVRVGEHDATKGGIMFVVNDRSGNIGFFYDTSTKWETKVQLGDCFAMHATPTRHVPAENGEKHTIFRSVRLLADTIVTGTKVVDPANDSTGGKFTRNVPF